MGRFQPHAVPEDAEAQARFTFQFPIEMVGVVAEFARDLPQADAGREALTELFEQGRTWSGLGPHGLKEPGNDGEDSWVIRQSEPAFARDTGQQTMELVEGRG